jgi:hypothetical protein
MLWLSRQPDCADTFAALASRAAELSAAALEGVLKALLEQHRTNGTRRNHRSSNSSSSSIGSNNNGSGNGNDDSDEMGHCRPPPIATCEKVVEAYVQKQTLQACVKLLVAQL